MMVMRFEVVRGMRGLSQAITVTPSLRAAEGYVEAARVYVVVGMLVS